MKCLFMDQNEKRKYLIRQLLSERPDGREYDIPEDTDDQKRLLRSLFNVRLPGMISRDFLDVQDEYLKEEIRLKGITDIADLKPYEDGLFLWQGDITTLKCDAIVNAANSGLTGCYVPCHMCIDNCIHTFSGIQLRNACADIMEEQGHEEPAGGAKITLAYNLPGKYVIHTVGPIISGEVTDSDDSLLKSCYLSCLELAEKNNAESIAFCCISTGVFRFPNRRAAKIAVETVREYRSRNNSKIKVVFNVWKDIDYDIYHELLGKDQGS